MACDVDGAGLRTGDVGFGVLVVEEVAVAGGFRISMLALEE